MSVGESRVQDVRLGDVVVSKPSNEYGGVWQYDYGKAIQDRKFKYTGHLNQPPQLLLAAMDALAVEFGNGNNIDRDVNEALSNRRRKLREKYRRPGPETDRLYKSSFVHRDDKRDCSTLCGDGKMTIARAPRGSNTVAIHHGLIASANCVMRNAIVRDSFARDYGVLCFEMEAAGLMNQFPFLVIRGICDYSNTHKNKQWQGYAAMTAAIYAKRLLFYWY